MNQYIVKQGDKHVFWCNGIEFPVFAVGEPSPDGVARTETAALVDSVMSGVNHSVTAWQVILMAEKLPVDPWVEEAAKPIVMGIIQNSWYTFFKGDIPEKVSRRQNDRVREYPEMLKVLLERKQQANERAQRMAAKKAGLTPEEAAAKKAAKDAAKAEKKAAREAKKQAREAERAALKLLRDAERSVKTPRGPRAPRQAGVVKRYELNVAKTDVWSKYQKQKAVLVQALVKLNQPSTASEIAALCTFEGSRQSSQTVVNYYVHAWAKEQIVLVTEEKVAAPEPAATTQPVASASATTEKKKKDKKKGKK